MSTDPSEVVFNRDAEKFGSELADLARNGVASMRCDTSLLLLRKLLTEDVAPMPTNVSQPEYNVDILQYDYVSTSILFSTVVSALLF